MHITSLSSNECYDIVKANEVGRLACCQNNRPYIVPIGYVYDCADRTVYSVTLPGKKLDILRANPSVALLIEVAGEGREWRNVLVEGQFEELSGETGFQNQRDLAWSFLNQRSNWWEPGLLKPDTEPAPLPESHVYFRIHLDEVSGRSASTA